MLLSASSQLSQPSALYIVDQKHGVSFRDADKHILAVIQVIVMTCMHDPLVVGMVAALYPYTSSLTAMTLEMVTGRLSVLCPSFMWMCVAGETGRICSYSQRDSGSANTWSAGEALLPRVSTWLCCP